MLAKLQRRYSIEIQFNLYKKVPNKWHNLSYDLEDPPGEGKSYPPVYSGLRIPDYTVHGVSKS